jgi:TRAP-type uncharacterized transport system fused permease subunit
MPIEDAHALVASLPQELAPDPTARHWTPPLITMALLSAHMIIFWLSQDSNVTPPVCLTAFAAAAIAKTPPMATGVMSWKLAKGLYLVPVLIAYTNFIGGTPLESDSSSVSRCWASTRWALPSRGIWKRRSAGRCAF